MEDTTTINLRRVQYLEALALIERIAAAGTAAWRAIPRLLAAIAKRQERARARIELHRLSDHMLRDIGLERGQIDRLFH